MATDLEQLQRRVAALTTLQKVAQELMTELDLERLLQKILQSAIQVLDGSEGSLLIWVPSDELVFAVSEDARIVGHRMPADKGIAGWVFTYCQPLIVGDVSQDERFFPEVDQYLGFKTQSLIAVPLMTPTEKLGVVQVLNKRSNEQFDEQDLDTLSVLAAQAAVMFVNARLYQELEQEKDRMLALEDQTHKKLARDLHDGPAQTLAAMMMNVELILRLYEHDPRRVPAELTEVYHAAGKTLNQIRNAMFELRPVILETQGLQAALEYYVDRQNSTEDMNIYLDVRDLTERLPPRVESLCFSIIREAIGNVKKHAGTRNAWIVVERREDDLIVAVRDDGAGFDVSSMSAGYDRRGSLGLLNIKERSEMLGARYAIESVPGQGTLVYLVVPLADQPVDIEETVLSDQERLDAQCRQRRKPKTGPLGWTPSAQRSDNGRRKGTGPLGLLGQKTTEQAEA